MTLPTPIRAALRRLEQTMDLLVADAIRWHSTGESPDASRRLHGAVLNYKAAARAYEALVGEGELNGQ
jgi:hypothetical protein